MKHNKEPRDQERRAFLKKSALVGAGTAAASVASAGAIADISDDSVEKPVQKGYQLTQHVIDYYKSADV